MLTAPARARARCSPVPVGLLSRFVLPLSRARRAPLAARPHLLSRAHRRSSPLAQFRPVSFKPAHVAVRAAPLVCPSGSSRGSAAPPLSCPSGAPPQLRPVSFKPAHVAGHPRVIPHHHWGVPSHGIPRPRPSGSTAPSTQRLGRAPNPAALGRALNPAASPRSQPSGSAALSAQRLGRARPGSATLSQQPCAHPWSFSRAPGPTPLPRRGAIPLRFLPFFFRSVHCYEQSSPELRLGGVLASGFGAPRE